MNTGIRRQIKGWGDPVEMAEVVVAPDLHDLVELTEFGVERADQLGGPTAGCIRLGERPLDELNGSWLQIVGSQLVENDRSPAFANWSA